MAKPRPVATATRVKHTKFIFVTGGVVSSLGKGLCAASMGALLEARGIRTRSAPVGHAEAVAADELLVTSARQAAVLQHANGALYSAEAALERGEAVELIAAELRVAAARLGELTGQEVSSHVIDEIFARFCVGK